MTMTQDAATQALPIGREARFVRLRILENFGKNFTSLGEIEVIEGSAAGYRSVLSAKPQAELVSEQGEQETPDPGEPVEFSEQEAQAGSPRKSQIRLFCGTWEPVAPMLREKLRIHAASKPGATRAGLQDSARTRPRGHYPPPGFDTIQ